MMTKTRRRMRLRTHRAPNMWRFGPLFGNFGIPAVPINTRVDELLPRGTQAKATA